MSPRKKLRPARSTIPGLRRRGARAYWTREFPKEVGGDRVSRALDAEWDTPLAVTRAGALNTLYDRGDWSVLRRWAEGALHISRVQASVRDHDWQALRTLDREGVRLGAALDAHLARVGSTLQPQTLRLHTTVANVLRAELGADYDMAALSTADAEAILHATRVAGKPWGAGTQASTRIVAGAIWRSVIEQQAEEAELSGMLPALTRNPWKRARAAGHRRIRPPVLDAGQMRALLTHRDVEGTPAAAMLAIGLLAGLRQAEILHLRVGVDVLLEEGLLRVQSRKGTAPHAWRAKTARSERDVPITAALAAIIREHVRRGYAGERYLLTTPQTGNVPITGTTSDRWTRLAFTAAGLPYGRHSPDGMTIHHTRHSYATLLLSGGVSLAEVAKRMGDRQETVLSTYSHAIPADHDRAMRILEGVL
jgi:integrase